MAPSLTSVIGARLWASVQNSPIQTRCQAAQLSSRTSSITTHPTRDVRASSYTAQIRRINKIRWRSKKTIPPHRSALRLDGGRALCPPWPQPRTPQKRRGVCSAVKYTPFLRSGQAATAQSEERASRQQAPYAQYGAPPCEPYPAAQLPQSLGYRLTYPSTTV